MQSRRPSRLLPGLLLASALFTRPLPALALDLPLQISQYAHTAWTAREGVNLGLVFAMAQTPDGYLWIGASFGLFRFDGIRFTLWQPPDGQTLPSGPYSLAASRDGTLWIGTYAGLSSWDGRQFVPRHPEIGERFVTSLLEGRDGTVWAGLFGEPGQVCAIRAGKATCSRPPAGSFGGFVWSLTEDRDGALWVGADTGVWRWRPGTPQRFPMPGLRVADLSTTVDGQVLAGVAYGGLRQLEGDHLVPHRLRRASQPNQWLDDSEVKANKLLRDRDGGLWIGTSGLGLMHVKDGQADTLTRAEGLSGNVACGLFEDREGNIWFGSERGLDRFRKLAVTTLSTPQGLPDEVTRSVVATPDGSIWVATNDGLARWKDRRPTVYRQRDGLPNAHVQSQYVDAEGRLWVSTTGGLAYFANDRFVAVDAGPSTEINAMAGDAEGNLWLSGNKGLAHLRRGRFVENLPWAALSHGEKAQGIIADRGGLWLSFWSGDVSYFKDGKIQVSHTSAPGLRLNAVYSLRLDADGTLWASTSSGGLSRIKNGQVTRLSTANGLPCNTIHWSTLDRHGSLWMYTGCGLVRVSHEDLSAWIANPAHRVAARLWGATDGVPVMDTPAAYFNPPVAQDADGKLWMAGAVELQVIDPDHMPSNPVPPPVHVERLVADQKAYPAADGLRLPPLVRDITIEFAALSLADPSQTHFRYWLEGHDNDWQEVVDRRLATYTNLPPGNYRFRVKASNNSGVWNEEGAQLRFSIPPALYQITWFRVACAALLIGLAGVGFQFWLHMRIRRLQRQFEATLEARVAERTRIARDLHDTLLQHFHGLLLQFQAAFNLLPERPRESRQILGGAIDAAAEAITEGRDTVKGLRATALETNNLAQALRALAEHLASESGHAVTPRVEVQGEPQDLHPLVRDETFRIAGEALRNAFRHAAAKHIDVEVRYEPRQLRVTVRDDGKGIDPEVLRKGEKEGHFGLNGMRERAELIGGKLAVRRNGEKGTEVEFRAPGSQAYSKPLPARSWLLPRKLARSEVAE
jgi:signal transduction histidine kinase/ligand-binding sensor domain-containing protein